METHHRVVVECLAAMAVIVLPILPTIITCIGGLLACTWYAIQIHDRFTHRKEKH